jgi:pyridoxamine 5'-phosphate oxidase
MLTTHLEKLFGAGALPNPLPSDPMPLFRQWFEEARRAGQVPNPDAMILATRGDDGAPSARTVLCKSIEGSPTVAPSITFYTNYEGRKARELLANPRCACVFHWDHVQRQVRVEGVAAKVAAKESDDYFRSRALLSRLGAWASLQSRPMARPSDLLQRMAEVAERFAVSPADLLAGSSEVEVPRPAHWGGFRITISRLELWAGRSGRLHDRAAWTREGDGWKGEHLYP